MLADVAGDDGLPAGEPVDFAHQLLRLDLRVRSRGVERMLLFPAADLPPPGLALGSHVRGGLSVAFREQLVEPPQHPLDVAHDGHVGGAVLADFGRVDIHVNHLGVGREGGQPAGDAIVETNAQGHDQIAVGEGHVGGVTAVHAGHADKIGMFARKRAQTHQRHYRGRVGQFHEFPQISGRVGRHDAAAGIYQRTRRFLDQLRGAADLPGMPLGEHFVAGQVDGRHRLVMSLALKYVFGNVHQHRAGAAAGGNVERFVNRLG